MTAALEAAAPPPIARTHIRLHARTFGLRGMDQWVEAFVNETSLTPERQSRWTLAWHLMKAEGKTACGKGADDLTKPPRSQQR